MTGSGTTTNIQHPMIDGVTDRVAYIADLMGRNKWHPRRTRRELATVWDVAESTVQNYSAEAGRLIEDGIKPQRAAIAMRAIRRLERDAIRFSRSDVPGAAMAAKGCNEVLLKASGFAEPEEDKQRGPMAFIIGTVITSPGMQALVGGARRLNGHAANGTNGAIIDSPAEGANGVPAPDRHS